MAVGGAIVGDGEADGDLDDDGETDALTERLALTDGLIEADADRLALLDGLTEAEAETDGLTLALALTDGDRDADGLSDVLGLTLADGETDAEALSDGETLVLGEIEADGDTDAVGLTEALAETDGEIEALGETEADGDTDAEAETDADTDGLIEDHAFTVVRHNGKLVSVDSYELDYSGRLLEDLTGPKGIRTGSYLAPWGRPVSNNRTVAVLEFHDFPKVWPLAPKMPESSSFVPARRLEARTTSIKIGPELTFTNDEMVNAEWMMSNGDVSAIRPENQQALEKFKIRIQAICKQFGCKVEGQFHLWPDGWRTPEVKVVYPDGWWFIAGLDTSVLEFQAKEMSLGDLSRVKRRIEEHIFETCKDIGLKPRSGVGGGHIHIDLTSAFPEDGKLLRDFIVDYSNHPGLAYGALTMDRGNATPIAKLRPDQKIAFRKVISDFDHGIIKGREQLATELERRVYFRSPAYGEPPQKYMAVNLTRVTRKNVPDSFRTVELRALRAQQSADDLEKLGELFERRINFLKSQPERVPVGSLSPPGSDAEVYSQFRSYVEGPGLDFSRFENLLPEKFRKAGLIDPSKCTVRWLQSILASP